MTVFLISIALLAITLFVVLYNWRDALVSWITIPVTLLTVILIFLWQGITIDSMVFTGLVVALFAIIDDAIIDIENVRLKLGASLEGKSGKSFFDSLIEGAFEMRSSMIFATLILVLAVIPVYFMQDLLGAFLQPMMLSFVLGLLISTAVALLLTPALGMLLAKQQKTTSSTSS